MFSENDKVKLNFYTIYCIRTWLYIFITVCRPKNVLSRYRFCTNERISDVNELIECHVKCLSYKSKKKTLTLTYFPALWLSFKVVGVSFAASKIKSSTGASFIVVVVTWTNTITWSYVWGKSANGSSWKEKLVIWNMNNQNGWQNISVIAMLRIFQLENFL